MIINNNKLNIKKPKSVILNEIEELKEKEQETKSIIEKIKIKARIEKLSFQLRNQ